MEIKDFVKRFNDNPEYIFSAPSRINLIGEHIDYNGGKVFPCAISLYTKAFVSRRKDLNIRLYSENTKTEILADFNNLNYDKSLGWANYPLGIFYILKQKGYELKFGLNIFYSSNIPLGSGLSSSASILDLTTFICNYIYNLELDNLEIALIAHESEVNYNGLLCGIMDEAIIALGKKNNALLLDTNSLKYEYVPINLNNASFVVLNTNVPRSLTESKYNERVAECNLALDIIKTKFNISNLCELKSSDLSKIMNLLNDKLFRRVKHIILENERVELFTRVIKNNDLNILGIILNESHKSLKEDYEVTGKYLDLITSLARKYAYGARMTGAGFSGCAIALVSNDKIEEMENYIKTEYKKLTSIDCDIYKIDIVDGPKGELL